jgi:hypothetical protein
VISEDAELKQKTFLPNSSVLSHDKLTTQKILSDNGLNKGVALSMQSLFEPALVNIKRQNITLQTYEELQRSVRTE